MRRKMCVFLIWSTVTVFPVEYGLAQATTPSSGIPLQTSPAQTQAGPVRPGTATQRHVKHPKLSTQIADLARAVTQRTTPLAANEKISFAGGFSVEGLPKSVQDATKAGMMKINPNGEVQVYIEVTSVNEQRLAELQSYGVIVQIVGKPSPDKTKGEVLSKVPTVQGLLPDD